MLKLSDVWSGLCIAASGVEAVIPAESAAQSITQVVIDSRVCEQGALFVALSGSKTNGHAYLADAFARGALAAVAEPAARALDLAATYILPDGGIELGADVETAGPPYIFVVPSSLVGLQQLAASWRRQMPVIATAITGSVGKTTTKETVANVLAQRYVTLRSQGNQNNELGVPLTLLQLTPQHERAVIEMGMYDLGEIAGLCRMAQPRYGVVTNVGPTHLERLGTIERIAAAKSELVQALPPADEGGVAILNGDDVLVQAMGSQTRARVITYGFQPTNDLWADEITSEGLAGISFQFHYGSEHFHLRLPVLGRHSVQTALAAAAIGLVEGLSWTEIITGLQAVDGQLRLMVTPGLRDTTLIDDTYNASPASMLAALNLLEDIANTEQRCIAVLGDMLELGVYEEEGHRVVGGRAAQVVHKLITVGQRARWIAEAAKASGMEPADVYPTDSNNDALALLQGLIRSGDIVLIKGSRGQAMESIVDGLARPQAVNSEHDV